MRERGGVSMRERERVRERSVSKRVCFKERGSSREIWKKKSGDRGEESLE